MCGSRLFGKNNRLEPGDENVGLGCICGKLRMLALFTLEHGHARQTSEEPGHQDRGEDAHPAGGEGAVDEVDAPPDEGFAEVVWMPGVLPQTPLDELRLSLGRICDMLRQLPVCHHFHH